MEGREQPLIRFFEGAEKRFIIPLYQRNYDWNEKNCNQLFNDLVALHQQGRKSHFFGSVVSSRADSFSDDRLIIDGQQRITTVSLILIALVNAAKANEIGCTDRSKIDYIWETYLVDKYQENERKVKLKPIKKDLDAFDALLYRPKDEYLMESNVTRNYLFFYDKVTTCGLSLEEFLTSIKKLWVISIKLSQDDDPQLIFESLNSTGMDLSEADKIRNFLLMSFDNEKQERYYNLFWNKIEECTDYKPTMFIRDFLTIKLRRICNTDVLYFEFKDFVNQFSSREQSMEEMREYAQYYRQMTKAETANKRINRKISQLNNIGSTVGMPFYMQFLKYAKDGELGDEEIFRVLDLIENYWARRIMCGFPANALSKVFCTLHNDVIKHKTEHQKRGIELQSTYCEILKFVLLKKQGTGWFPRDQYLTEQFKVRQVYKMPMDYRYFLFERMENENGMEIHDVVKEMKAGRTTIEHIMPQTLTTRWKEALGDDFERIHNEYLHTFANLTLTGYNTSYSNHTFEEKKNGYIRKGNHVYGFCDSGYRLNKFLKECDEWNEAKILERQQILLGKFLGLWPMIKTNYEPLRKETEVVSLDEDVNLTGRSIVAFLYKGKRYDVTTWKDMLLQVCKLVYSEKTSEVRILCDKDYWFHHKDAKEHSPIAPGCYVYSSCSTQTKKTILNILFDGCNIPTSDLEFELVPIQEETDNADESNEE